jgi:hypothetical protein
MMDVDKGRPRAGDLVAQIKRAFQGTDAPAKASQAEVRALVKNYMLNNGVQNGCALHAMRDALNSCAQRFSVNDLLEYLVLFGDEHILSCLVQGSQLPVEVFWIWASYMFINIELRVLADNEKYHFYTFSSQKGCTPLKRMRVVLLWNSAYKMGSAENLFGTKGGHFVSDMANADTNLRDCDKSLFDYLPADPETLALQHKFS